MSQTICMYNYEYNGHVYSPAFSDPPSPDPTSSKSGQDSEEEEQYETSSSPPPVTSLLPKEKKTTPSHQHQQTPHRPWSALGKRQRRESSETAKTESAPFVNKKPRYPTKYHALLQPMEPAISTAMPVSAIRPTHKASFVPEVQSDFHAVLRKSLRSSDNAHLRSSDGANDGSAAADAHSDDLERFLSANADRIDVNQYVGESGQTPLHLACLEGRVGCAKLLVRFGADWRLTTRDGFSSMHIAAFSGCPDVMLYIMSLK